MTQPLTVAETVDASPATAIASSARPIRTTLRPPSGR